MAMRKEHDINYVVKPPIFGAPSIDNEGVVPSNIPLSGNVLKRDELIKLYFMEGLKYAEIVLFLFCNHNIKMTIRHLKRILRKLNLRRRPIQYSPTQDVVNIIREECNVSGQCVGYRTMRKRLIRDYGLAVKRNDVMKILQQIFPNATEERKAHRLKRRMYTLKGPNYMFKSLFILMKPYAYSSS
ncbi:hypothetical protein KUTeg_007212 [Tegillarca granosa]|uniref:Uncharacterized protein n=1 Tax=Tegillarca granosa TaxID=220873 RepID=A0ABQ9FEY1_TEGGR|nr:hypothetical protein KUTeg_007212 [Tegillarca granosa]